MNMNLIEEVTKQQVKSNLPRLVSGDTVKVYFKIQEGTKYRIQIFEGLVIKTQGKGINYSVMVRKVSNGAATERIFPLHSPLVDKVEVVKHGKVRRARIYYMRKLTGKAARIKEIIEKK